MDLSTRALPLLYLMTPNPDNEDAQDQFIDQLEKSLINGIRLVQLRAKNLNSEKYKELALKVMACCRQYDAACMLNAPPELVAEVNAHGVHLDGVRLNSYERRPVHSNKLVSVACHSLAQIRKAELIGADMVTLSPVLHTESHPEATPMGWKSFSLIARQTALPVFAFGGMNRQLLSCAQANGAYGIGGIRSFWSA